MTEPERLSDLSVFAASLAAAKTQVDGNPYTLLPPDWTVDDLSHLLLHPTRPKGTVTFQDPTSFIQYVKYHKNTGTAIYADLDVGRVTAILNDHEPEGSPGHRDFKAVYLIVRSREWTAWRAANGSWKSHGELAEFCEEQIDDFLAPDGATMMEIVLSLEAKKSVSFRSAVRLDNGAFSIGYDEDIRGSVKAGTMEIPSKFTIYIPILKRHDTATSIEVRLRYRLRDAAISFQLRLQKPDQITEETVGLWIADVERETGVPVYIGSSPGA